MWFRECVFFRFPLGKRRADSIRPYCCGGNAADGAYAFILVLPEIRGFGRILSAPTVGVCKTVFEW